MDRAERSRRCWPKACLFVCALLVSAQVFAGCAPAALSGGQTQPTATTGSLIFFSNQFKPVEEQARMQDAILKDAPVKVDYIPEDPGPFNDRLAAEQKAGKVTVSLIGGLHGDLEPFARAGYLEDLSPLVARLGDRGIAAQFMALTRIGEKDKTYYIPWMQATYVIAINKKALPSTSSTSSDATCGPAVRAGERLAPGPHQSHVFQRPRASGARRQSVSRGW